MSLTNVKRCKKVLAVASGGGHWVQLMRLSPAFVGFEVVFVGVSGADRSQVANHRFYPISDATRWDKLALIRVALKLAWINWKERPDVVVSTGAAPGYFAILLGKLFGARTLWLDSIANVERLSMSGEMAGRHADLWLTQWPRLERPDGPYFKGSIL